MLWSLGKDSNTMVWLAKKAFFGHVPFPVVHVDTGKKFREMYAFRSRYAAQWNLNLIVRPCADLLDNPEQRARMGAFGRRRVQDELEWRYEAPKLLSAYDALWAKTQQRQQPAT
jgi:3'-phosphoadenosine 5'-phosphosulfate sulfotransferase (PAPS reductase)/FAD synthetase